MRPGVVICVLLGHRWQTLPGEGAGVVELRCRRCGHEMTHSAETFEPEPWAERRARGVFVDEPFAPHEWLDPRVKEPRRPD